MSDEERKEKASHRDHDHEEEGHEASHEDREGEDADEAATEREIAEAEGDETEGEHADGSKAARRVASALGVDGEGEEAPTEAAAETEGEAAVQNRAARRAEAAQRRKKRKAAVAKPVEGEDEATDEALPKDKNARAKELLKRRREQAASAEARPIQLLPGEMVDDALARSGSAVSKWLRENFTIIQWVVLAALAGGGVYLFYQSRTDKRDAAASAALMAGVEDDRGRVLAEDKRSDEEKEADTGKVFKTAAERTDTALAAYKKVVSEHGGSAAAILAELGEAGDYLDKQDWPHALEAYSAVAASPLAGADPDVKGRALEGLGFAKEGKGDLDGALASFKELEGVDARGFKELGLYHQGRVWLAKGDKDKAKDFLKQVHDKLEQPTGEASSFRYLQQMTDETLRRIDPSLVPNKAPAIGGPKGGAMTPDEIDKIKRQLMDQLKQKDHQ